MRNRLLLGFFLFALLASALLVIPVGFTLEARDHSNILAALRRDTSSLSTLLANDLNHGDVLAAERLSHTYTHSTGRQVMVVDLRRVVLATRPRQAQDPVLLRIVRAARRAPSSGVAARSSFEGPQYYVAVPLPNDEHSSHLVNHSVIVTFPVTVVTRTVRSDWRDLGLYAILMLAAAGLFGFAISNSLVRPLKQFGRAVDAIGSGHLDVRAPVTSGPPELRRLGETVNATAARLISLLEAQRTFVEDASHQLRTPLTALQLHLENLHDSPNISETEDFAAVFSEIGRLNRLVDSLLALAKNESRKPILVAVDAETIVRERVEYWRPFAEERSLELTIAIDPGLRAAAIEGILEQLLDNLLSNAFDASPAAGRITVSGRKVESDVEIHVIDSGSGLSEAERSLAIRRFWRGRSSGGEGSGLGLSIVDQLVRLSNGTFELREASTGGVDATIILKTA